LRGRASDRGVHEPMVGDRAGTTARQRFALDSYYRGVQCGDHLPASGPGRGIPAPGIANLASHRGGFCGDGHGDVDGDRVAKAVRDIAGADQSAGAAAFDFWDPISAWFRCVLVALGDRTRSTTDARDGVVDGHPYRRGSAAVCVLRFCGFDLLPD